MRIIELNYIAGLHETRSHLASQRVLDDFNLQMLCEFTFTKI